MASIVFNGQVVEVPQKELDAHADRTAARLLNHQGLPLIPLALKPLVEASRLDADAADVIADWAEENGRADLDKIFKARATLLRAGFLFARQRITGVIRLPDEDDAVYMERVKTIIGNAAVDTACGTPGAPPQWSRVNPAKRARKRELRQRCACGHERRRHIARKSGNHTGPCAASLPCACQHFNTPVGPDRREP